jgi:hypothetical protein
LMVATPLAEYPSDGTSIRDLDAIYTGVNRTGFIGGPIP